MNLNDVCAGLFAALEKFDEDTLPLGLYASDELVEAPAKCPHFHEWQGAIKPFLQTQKCNPTRLQWPREKYGYYVTYRQPEMGNVALYVLKFSNIKVRKYGSAYHVDKHENRTERWREVDLPGHIGNLWKQPDWFTIRAQAQVLLFIGFDKAQRPLEAELKALHSSLRWENKGVDYQTVTWPDKAARGFGVRLACWSKLINTD